LHQEQFRVKVEPERINEENAVELCVLLARRLDRE